MRIAAFIIFAYVGLALDISFMQAFRFKWGAIVVWPSVLTTVAVFVALFAPRMTALWACLALGALVDLAARDPALAQISPVLGPHALGYVFGAVTILQLRAMVFRRRAITLGFLTALFVLCASLVVVAIYVIRSWFPATAVHWTDLRPMHEVLRRFVMALYCGLFAIPLGWLLIRTIPFWGFPQSTQRLWR